MLAVSGFEDNLRFGVVQEQLHVCDGGSKVVLAVARFELDKCGRLDCNYVLAVVFFSRPTQGE